MPITEKGLMYNHIIKEAYIFNSETDGRCCVRFREEIGVSWSVREVWYPTESMAWTEITKFVKQLVEE